MPFRTFLIWAIAFRGAMAFAYVVFILDEVGLAVGMAILAAGFVGGAVAVHVGNFVSVHLGVRLPMTDPGAELIGPHVAAMLTLIDVVVVVVPSLHIGPVLGVVIASGLAGSAFGFLQRVPV